MQQLVGAEWLLEHEQVERIELGEMICVIERVRGVGVGHDLDVGPTAWRTARTYSTSRPAESSA